MTGTLLNVAAVLLGATIGLLLGNRLPDRVRGIAVQAVGLVTLLIGVQMALQVQNMLILLASLVVGGAVGEWLGVEQRLNGLGRAMEQRFGSTAARPPSGGPDNGAVPVESRFVRAFVTSSLVFCVGPMTILGAIQDGLFGDIRLLAVKSLLDGLTSIAFASTLGPGVYASTLVILGYQGGIAGVARLLGSATPDLSGTPAVLEMTAAGGLLIVGIGLRLLDIRAIPVGNLLPAVALAPILTALLGPPLARLLNPG